MTSLQDLRTRMSSLKGDITRRINILDQDLVSEDRVSRTALRMKIANLQRIGEQLKTVSNEATSRAKIESDKDEIQDYLLHEEDRIINILGKIEEHLCERSGETTTVFGSSQAEIVAFREAERIRLLNERDQSDAQIREASRKAEEASLKAEEAKQVVRINQAAKLSAEQSLQRLELGSRAEDFMETEGIQREYVQPSLTNWMANPHIDHSASSSRGARLHMPIEIPKFNGEVVQFSEWSNMFQALVHDTGKSVPEKMGLLKASLGPTCKDLLAGFGNSEIHYLQALRLLHQVFGDEKQVVRAHLKAIESLPPVKARDSKSLASFTFKLQGHLLIIQEHVHAGDSAWGHLENVIERKLDQETFNLWDFHIQDRATSELERVEELKNWLLRIAMRDRRRIDPLEQSEATTNRSRAVSSTNTTQTRLCQLCNSMHEIWNCPRFTTLTPSTRFAKARDMRLCFGCLGGGHSLRDCTRKRLCRKEGCNYAHHPLLHMEVEQKQNVNVSKNVSAFRGSTVLGMIPIRVIGPNGELEINALVDEGSDSSFIEHKVVKKIGLTSGKSRQVTIHGATGVSTFDSKDIVLEVGSPRSLETFNLRLKTLPTLCRNLSGHKWDPKGEGWDHLKGLPLSQNTGKVQLLLGIDAANLIEPLEIRRGRPGEPYAIRTRLGWICRGRVGLSNEEIVELNLNFLQETDDIASKLERFFCTENYGSEMHGEAEPNWSPQERYAYKTIQETIVRLPEGGYEVALPWIPGNPKPKNNRSLAQRRFQRLENRFEKDIDFRIAYVKAMRKNIDEGYAEKVIDPIELQYDQQAFLPHHGVWKKNREQIRVVFDATAKYGNVSLNDCLMTGPALQNNILDVLIRFRENRVAITADIEAMFSRVQLKAEDARFHRFLWRENPTDPLEVFQMRGVVFGDSPSPCLAISVLLRTSEDNHCSEVVKQTIKHQFYVDDYLDSGTDPFSVIELAKKVQQVLSAGNFNLRGWASNSSLVRESLGGEQKIETHLSGPMTQKVLGLKWNLDDDVMIFEVDTDESITFTRRGLLSKLAGIYDPMGLCSPVVTAGKIMMKCLVIKNANWDDLLENEEQIWWMNWFNELESLSKVRFPRCISPLKDPCSSVLHVFCDASEEAFGAVAYLRTRDTDGRVEVRLITAKTRVSPKRPLTIPRLELQGALLAARMAKHLEKNLRLTLNGRVFWTDSQVVRAWITNVAHTFQPYVAHRVGEVQSLTNTKEWRHVPGLQNPADLVTRATIPCGGIPPIWIFGPKFLHESESNWPGDVHIPQTNEEVRSRYVQVHTTDQLWGTDCETLRDAIDNFNHSSPKKGLMALIARAQDQMFPNELAALTLERPLPKNSHLLELSPFVDEFGVLRARGRLSQAQIGYDERHPILLSPYHPLSKLIMQDDHLKNNHPGVNHGLACLRRRYWVLRGREAVKKTMMECNHCRKMKAQPATQEMADLPIERMGQPRPPFFYTSVDLFGPIEVLISRTRVEKRWIVLFTCMTIRAVHLEMTPSLSTEDFLNCLRNFICLRGQPYQIYCDNGCNFVGAKNLLNSLRITCFSQDDVEMSIKWKFQVPGAPHWGGVHESLVKSAKRAMTNILTEEQRAKRHLREDELRVVLCEVMGFLNSRPLTYESTDPSDARVLTPNHFLLLRGNVSVPPGDYARMDTRLHFRYVQGIVDRLWDRWTSEYLPNVLSRNKWKIRKENLKVGDEVLIVGTPEPRGRWKTGRIETVHPGTDGLVRSVTVRTGTTILTRPINKVCPLTNATWTNTKHLNMERPMGGALD